MNIREKTIQNGEPTPEHPVDIENKINILLAIEILNKLKSKVTLVEADEKEYRLPFLMNIEQQAIETILSELEKKDKVINEMAIYIDQLTNELVSETGDNNLKCCESKECLDNGDLECKDCIIKYYTNKVEREGK